MNHRLAEVLDRGLDDVRHGRSTVEQVLQEHPLEAHTLEPLLRLALHIDAGVSEPLDAAGRVRIAARIQAGMMTRPHRRSFWSYVTLPNTQHLAFAASAAVLVLAVLTGGGLVAASTGAAPGDSLYGLKLRIEPVELALRGDDDLERATRLSERRLAELNSVAARGDAASVNEASNRYRRAYLALVDAADAARGDGAARAESLLDEQLVEVARLRERAGGRLDLALSPLLNEMVTSRMAFASRKGTTQETLPTSTPDPGNRDTAAPSIAARATPPPLATPTVSRPDTRDLLAAVARAEQLGILSRELAAEFRIIFQNVTSSEEDRAVLARQFSRLSAALSACSEQECVAMALLQQLHTDLARAADTLSLPEPSPLAAKAISTPQPGAGAGSAPVAVSSATSAPAQPTGANVTGTLAAPVAAAQDAPAGAVQPPATPPANPIPASTEATAGGPAGAAPAAAVAATGTPAPASIAAGLAAPPPPVATTRVATPAPTFAAGAAPVPSPAPARTPEPTAAAVPQFPPPSPTSTVLPPVRPGTVTPSSTPAPAAAPAAPLSPASGTPATRTPTPTLTPTPTPTPTPAPDPETD